MGRHERLSFLYEPMALMTRTMRRRQLPHEVTTRVEDTPTRKESSSIHRRPTFPLARLAARGSYIIAWCEPRKLLYGMSRNAMPTRYSSLEANLRFWPPKALPYWITGAS
jgi:hypothetical protein